MIKFDMLYWGTLDKSDVLISNLIIDDHSCEFAIKLAFELSSSRMIELFVIVHLYVWGPPTDS